MSNPAASKNNNITDHESTGDHRLVLPDILSKSRSADSDSTQLKAESKQGSDKQNDDIDQRRGSNFMVSEIKYYHSSNNSSGHKQQHTSTLKH